jgi:hypothetical protein
VVEQNFGRLAPRERGFMSRADWNEMQHFGMGLESFLKEQRLHARI